MDIFSFLAGGKTEMVSADRALPGRDAPPYRIPETHEILGTPLRGPWGEGIEVIYFGMGCFWGAEELFWQMPGVVCTAVGYQGGMTAWPTYEEVCSGRTGQNEAVLVAYDPAVTSVDEILRTFWEHHDPTQGFRQGNDVGTQYRSAIYYTTPEQRDAAERTRKAYDEVLTGRGFDPITTEIEPAEDRPFYFAEDYHQQYLHKNPHGYRCHANTGVPLPAV